MINRLYHAASSDVVQFVGSPIRGAGESAQRFQTSGYDSDGETYVYSKNSTKHRGRTLVYVHQNIGTLSAALAFIQSRNGDKSSFTWYDHDAAAHTVRFTTGNVKYNETSFGQYRIEIQLSEDI